MKYVLDDAGDPVPTDDALAVEALLASPAAAVAFDEVAGVGAVEVSTDFICFDQRRKGRGTLPPLLWETLVSGGPHDGRGDRYASRAAAEAGHLRWLDIVLGIE